MLARCPSGRAILLAGTPPKDGATMTTKSKKTPKKYPGFTAWITLKDGTRIYAKDYGYKGFPIGGKTK